MQIPNDMKDKLAQLQTVQQQLQLISLQKQQLTLDKAEAEAAEKELKTAKGDVYKVVGPILLKSEKAGLSKDLKKTIEEISNKLSLLEQQEQKIALKAQELQKELQAGFGVPSA